MAKISQLPTPYPHINVLLHRLLTDAQAALGAQFVGMYLYGSLASGDFDPRSSDVDFIVVTRDEIGEEMVPRLRKLHERLWAGDGMSAETKQWAAKLEGTYIPQTALCRYNPTDPPRVQVNEGQFYLAPQDSAWIIQRHILREHGVVLAGPPVKPLIDPVTPDELRGAVASILSGWWSFILADPSRLERHGYQPFCVLTMCRALYCFERGEIVSKPVAALWAMETLPARWKSLIEHSLTQQDDLSDVALAETQALIRHTIERAK